MRTITVAAIIALLTMPAYAQQSKLSGQSPSGSGQPQQTAQDKADQRQKILDEKAYRDSLARIPSSGQKADPWAKVR
jgi:hypothetical protein